jgi:hypothetical protein
MSRRKNRRGRPTQEAPAQERVLEAGHAASAKKPIIQPDGGGRSSVADLVLVRNARILQGKEVPEQPGEAGKRPVIEVADTPSDRKKLEDRALDRSEEVRKEIWRVAEENRQHYIHQMTTDQHPKPWFQYIKQRFQYAEFIMVDPDMAQALLQSQVLKDGTSANRKIKAWLLEEYKRDFVNGRWIPSDEGIGVNLSSCLFNGQHRLTAIVETGISYPLWITFNVLDEAKFVTDSGAKRTTSEKLQMVVDTRLGGRVAGMLKALMRGTADRMKFSDPEVAEFAAKWEHVIQWVKDNAHGLRAEVQAAIAKAYLWYGEDAIKPFCDRISNIQFDGEGDPAKALFVALQRAKVNRMNSVGVAYRKALSAIEAEIEGRTIQKLQGASRDTDLFVWLPGWELPPGAAYRQQQN